MRRPSLCEVLARGDLDGHALDAVHEVRTQEVNFTGALNLVDATDEVFEHDAQLDASQGVTQAHVGATATEGHVLVGVTSDIHLVRVLEDGLVAVAGGKPGDHLLALLDHRSVEVHVLGRGATEVVDGAGIAEELFNSPGDQLWVLLEESKLVRVVDEVVHGVSDGAQAGSVTASRDKGFHSCSNQ